MASPVNAIKAAELTPDKALAGGERMQRKCACKESGTNCERCGLEGKSLQRMASRSIRPDAVPPVVHDVLERPGKRMDPTTRGFMEQRFGQDFSGVKVHTDATAAKSAHSVGALAYTVGQNIVFGSGMYAPQSQPGKHILAHELAHVVQQRGNSSSEQTPLKIEDESGTSEGDAAHAANEAMSGRPVRLGTIGLGVHRLRCLPILLASESRIPGYRGVHYEAEIVSFAQQQLGPRIIPKFTIPGASAQAKRGEGCGKTREAKGQGIADLAITGDQPGVVEIAEIKIGTAPCLGLAEDQLRGYLDKANSPENKDWAAKNSIKQVKRMPMSRVDFSAYRSGVGTLPILLDWCTDGVIVYKPVNKRDEPRTGQPLGPSDQAVAGFALGFIAGWRQTVPGNSWNSILQKLKIPENYIVFTAAQIPGRLVGAAGSIADLVSGLGSLLKLGLEFSPVGVGYGEISALVKGEESPLLKRARFAKAIVEGLPALGAELESNPNLLFDVGEQFGNVCGEEVGRRFNEEFASADPKKMGYIVGQVEGYLAIEVAMLLIGAEELGAVGKVISKGARALEGSRFAQKLFAILKRIPAFNKLIEAAKAARAARIAEETAKAAKAGGRAVGEAADASKRVRVEAGEARNVRVEPALEEAVQAEPEAEGLKRAQVERPR
jgi:hypothetical protein